MYNRAILQCTPVLPYTIQSCYPTLYNRTILTVLSYTVQPSYAKLYNRAILYCTTVLSYTVQPSYPTLYNRAILHCTTLLSHTVQPYYLTLYSRAILHCTTELSWPDFLHLWAWMKATRNSSVTGSLKKQLYCQFNFPFEPWYQSRSVCHVLKGREVTLPLLPLENWFRDCLFK